MDISGIFRSIGRGIYSFFSGISHSLSHIFSRSVPQKQDESIKSLKTVLRASQETITLAQTQMTQSTKEATTFLRRNDPANFRTAVTSYVRAKAFF
jgi:hypothetical protein